MPSMQPLSVPTMQPSTQPSCSPTNQPSTQPSTQPSSQPSRLPTMQPSTLPSGHPSSQPSIKPSMRPSGQPSCIPSSQPSMQPSCRPSMQPSTLPSSKPTMTPILQPSVSYFLFSNTYICVRLVNIDDGSLFFFFYCHFLHTLLRKDHVKSIDKYVMKNSLVYRRIMSNSLLLFNCISLGNHGKMEVLCSSVQSKTKLPDEEKKCFQERREEKSLKA